MAHSPLQSGVAFFDETTQGTAPANGAAWASSGVRLRLIAPLDLSDIEQTMIADERNTDLIQGGSDIQMLQGTKNGTKSLTFALPGSEAVTADTNPVSQTEIGQVLEKMFGGAWHGYSTTAKTAGAHTGTAVELDSNTGYDEGGYLNHIDSNGKSNVRKITDLTGDVATVDEAFSETPSDGDKIAGCSVYYIDEDVLDDSNGSGGPYTQSWHLRTGGATSDGASYVLRGCVTQLDSIEMGKNQAMQLVASILYASYDDPLTAPAVTWGANAEGGAAGVPLGPNTHCFLQDKGTTTASAVAVQDVSLTPGIPRVAEEAITEIQDGMQGIARYGLGREDCNLSFNAIPYDTAFWTDFNAGTYKVCRISTRNAEGSNFAIELPNAEIAVTPKVVNGQAIGNTGLTLKGHPDSANSAAGTAALWRSKVRVIQY